MSLGKKLFSPELLSKRYCNIIYEESKFALLRQGKVRHLSVGRQVSSSSISKRKGPYYFLRSEALMACGAAALPNGLCKSRARVEVHERTEDKLSWHLPLLPL